MEPYDHDRSCPKCHFMAGTTDFHPGYHGVPCAIPGADIVNTLDILRSMWPGGTYPNAQNYRLGRDDPAYKTAAANAKDTMDDYKARVDAIPEHFDRACPNCKHLWAERPI